MLGDAREVKEWKLQNLNGASENGSGTVVLWYSKQIRTIALEEP